MRHLAQQPARNPLDPPPPPPPSSSFTHLQGKKAATGRAEKQQQGQHAGPSPAAPGGGEGVDEEEDSEEEDDLTALQDYFANLGAHGSDSSEGAEDEDEDEAAAAGRHLSAKRMRAQHAALLALARGDEDGWGDEGPVEDLWIPGIGESTGDDDEELESDSDDEDEDEDAPVEFGSVTSGSGDEEEEEEDGGSELDFDPDAVDSSGGEESGGRGRASGSGMPPKVWGGEGWETLPLDKRYPVQASAPAFPLTPPHPLTQTHNMCVYATGHSLHACACLICPVYTHVPLAARHWTMPAGSFCFSVSWSFCLPAGAAAAAAGAPRSKESATEVGGEGCQGGQAAAW